MYKKKTSQVFFPQIVIFLSLAHNFIISLSNVIKDFHNTMSQPHDLTLSQIYNKDTLR